MTHPLENRKKEKKENKREATKKCFKEMSFKGEWVMRASWVMRAPFASRIVLDFKS